MPDFNREGSTLLHASEALENVASELQFLAVSVANRWDDDDAADGLFYLLERIRATVKETSVSLLGVMKELTDAC